MRDPEQKHFMKNYYSMVIFFFMMLLALRLSGYSSAILSLAGLFISSPSIQIEQSRYRWWSLFLLFLLCIIFYPDLQGLKE